MSRRSDLVNIVIVGLVIYYIWNNSKLKTMYNASQDVKKVITNYKAEMKESVSNLFTAHEDSYYSSVNDPIIEMMKGSSGSYEVPTAKDSSDSNSSESSAKEMEKDEATVPGMLARVQSAGKSVFNKFKGWVGWK